MLITRSKSQLRNNIEFFNNTKKLIFATSIC